MGLVASMNAKGKDLGRTSATYFSTETDRQDPQGTP